MKVDGINAAELSSQYYYLDQTGLNAYFSPSAVQDNSGERYLRENNWRGQDLQSMLDRLHISQNKFLIIRLMQRGDIITLLQLLGKDKMIEAMHFFPRAKLIQFIHFLPKEMILKMLLWVIPLKNLLQFFPTESIFNILRSKRLEVQDMVRGFENLPREVLLKLMGDITGQNMDKMSHPELMAMFRQLNKGQLLEGMKKMPQNHLLEYIYQQVKQDPELLMMMPRGDLMKVVQMMPKPNLVELFRLLDENMLVTFLAQLPEKFLALAAAQLDDKTFGAFLMSKYPDLIASLAAAA